jgi:long-chain fatty acid transport protein
MWICVAVSGFAGGAAWASGFALRDGFADWTANVEAGGAAKAYDASSVSYIDPYTHFTGLDSGAAQMVSPTRNGADPAVTGGLFAAWSLSPDLKLGFAATTPFGSRIDYPASWPGRYQSLVANVTDVEMLISAAYRITDRLSIGAGPVIDNFRARMTQAVDLGAVSALTGDPIDGSDGDDTALGYDAGALFQATDALRFGFNYRSRITHNIQGTQTVTVPDQLELLSPMVARQLSILDGRSRSQITLPDTADLSGYYQILPELAVMATIEWTHWSLFNNLTIVPANAGASASSVSEDWRNTWFASLGVNYRVAPALLLQGGLGYDETPVRSAATRYAGFPDVNRIVLGGGLTWTVVNGLDVVLGYNHLFGLSAPINSSTVAGTPALSGTAHLSANVVSVGAKAKF